ncbi:MAG: sensor histidine kinase [Thermoanaerobaculaceae bacterium]
MSGLPVRRFSEVRWLFGAVIVVLLTGTFLLLAAFVLWVVVPQEGDESLLAKAATVAVALQQPQGVQPALGAYRVAVYQAGKLQWSVGLVPQEEYWPYAGRVAWRAAGAPSLAAGAWDGEKFKVVFWPLAEDRLLKIFAEEKGGFAWPHLIVALALLLSLLGGGLAWFLMGKVLAPYGALLEEARAFSGKVGAGAEDVFLVSTFSQAVRRVEEQEKELEAKAQEFSEMAAGLAHELRNQLSVVEGYLRLARENPQEVPRYLRQISEEVRLQRVFLERFLAFARPQELQTGRLQMAMLLPALKERLAAQFPQVRVEVAGGGEAVADATAVKVILENLMRNACEAVEHQADGWVKVTVEEGARHLEVKVMDNGPGIGADARDKLFQPFVSGKPTGGIGLALARRLARASGGDLILASAANPTVFVLRLRRWLEG